MKKISLVLLSLVLASGCAQPLDTKPISELDTTPSSADLTVNDFTPPTEVVRGMGDDGPYEMRLLSATSEDGVNWTRTDSIISEQANVPDMAVTKDGTIYLYYVGGNIMNKDQGIAAAVSQDSGATWTFKKVTINEGDAIGSIPGDPDITVLDDGTFRLYFTAQIKGSDGPGIQLAESTDGLNFTYIGQALKDPETMTIDSSAYILNGQWRMNTFTDFKTDVIQTVSEDDGLTYEIVKKENVEYDGVPYFLSNPFTLPDGSIRMWAFQLHPSEFRSFVTTDGLTWKDEGNVYLKYEEGEHPLEGYYIKDPAVVQLPDGTYFMTYVTRAPN